MIIINELTFNNGDNERHPFIWFIQLVLTFTTIILVGVLIYYHYVRLTLLLVHKPANHWRFALTNSTLYLILVEILICSIHPFPRWHPFEGPRMIRNQSRLNRSAESVETVALSSISFQVAFGLPSTLSLCHFPPMATFLFSSVCSNLSAVSIDSNSFASVSKCLFTISRLSQSRFH